MAGSVTQANPSTPTPPPINNVQFVDSRGFVTSQGLQFLQTLWAAATTALAAAIDTVDTPLPAGIGHSAVAWAPTLAGSATAGAGTYSTQFGALLEIGPLTLAAFNLVLTAFAGAAGNAVVGALPFVANPSLGLIAGWTASWGNITLGAGYTQVGVGMDSAVAGVSLYESGSALAPQPLPVSAVGATATLCGGVLFFR